MIGHFALRLICGMSGTWTVMSRREVTDGFFRIQMLVVLGLSVVSVLFPAWPVHERDQDAVSETSLRVLGTVLAVLAYVGSVLWTLNRRSAGTAIAYLIMVLSVVALARVSQVSDVVAQPAIWLIADLSSAVLLGTTVTAMLLGHWYLTAPTMSIRPLQRLTHFLGYALITRLIVSLTALVQAWGLVQTGTHWIWLVLRWTSGFAGPAVVCVLVWRILKYRNTQSATGVLFAGVILVFIGETTGALLARELGYPL